MSKIFRLYNEGTATYQDWNESPAFPYNAKSRDTIEDPDGASARNEITSIPSPFARIDLVKNAFKEVCKTDLDGDTIFHKMVSDTLDVAEIFFNIERFQEQIEIIKWDCSQMLNVLQQSTDAQGHPNVGHQCFGDVLSKYIQADGATYNFGQLQGIYLLNYVGANSRDELDIIGATSPATLFFCNANDLSYIKDISFGQDKPFDTAYQPLYKRDFELVKYLFALRSSIKNFATLFPEVNLYLNETLKAISDQAKKRTLSGITDAELKSLNKISVRNAQQNNIVEVLGYTLYSKDITGQPTQSDFIIKSSANATKLQPLVLPTEAGNTYADLQYVTDKWGKEDAAPYQDNQANLTMRKLPNVGNQYPYLTISDFLEDSIIRVPHTMNSECYFDGNIEIKEKRAYLLPIKPLFFSFFSTEELQDVMSDDKPMLEMRMLAGGSVKVTLRIPIKGNGSISYIEYERLYYDSRKPDIGRNEGGIKEFNFTGLVMPQVKFKKVKDAIYNVSCVQNKSGRVAFSFLKRGEKVGPAEGVCRDSTGKLQFKAENYFIEKCDFDCIQVTDNVGQSGMMIPIFKNHENIDPFEFAVDLGTSNTHIEFKSSGQTGSNSNEFSFTAADRQLCEMFTPTFDGGAQTDLISETELIEKDFIPAVVGNGDFHFPTRTVLSHSETTDWNNSIEPFTLVNLPFTYGKRRELSYNKFKCNIKWGSSNEIRVMEAYIHCLMLIMRNKVLLNNGDLSKTKVTWFYPISMPKKRVNRMNDIWNKAYNKYFGNGVTLSMTESVAPMPYLFNRHSTATDLVNVDIGGGTTDIAFSKNKEVQYVTSFRFAANTLFEDSFAALNNNNGIIDYHKGNILSLLENKNALSELVGVFNSADNENPANMASFLFSLKENSLINNAGLCESSIDFNEILRDDENFKVEFILFYTAIIYHIAQMVKELSLEVPRHISFSGNGSKVISVITTNTKDLANYTKLIFEKVIGKKYGKNLELLGLDGSYNPKESTCKGGIMGNANACCGSPKVVVFKSDCSGIVNEETYASVDRAYKERTVEATKNFFKFALEEIPKEFDLNNHFGVTKDSLQIAMETAKEDLETFLDKGVSQRLDEVDKDEVIDETFFFYPIKGALQAISGEIYKSLQNDENN